MASKKQKILTASVLAAALGAGLYFQLRTPASPRPPSLEAVMPQDMVRALADAGKKPGTPRAGRVASPETKTKAAAPAAADVALERTGRNALQVKITNAGTKPSSVRFEAGTIFEDDRAGLLLLKAMDVTVDPGESLEQELAVVALTSGKIESRGKFRNAMKTEPKLEPLMKHLESHPDLPVSVVQTAVLAILEDAPVEVFAQFPMPGADTAQRDGSYKVETCHIVAALQLLRDIGVNSAKMGEDPQLKIEAMIDLKAHDLAKQYYGISTEAEWAYWRHELLAGDPKTRHYALYGIARFYPDVALVMMPRWARETRTLPHYRRAAIGALALTQKASAKPVLQDLGRDLAKEKELAQRIEPALRYLEQNLPNVL
jgi:hypothetical protein